MLWFIQNIVFSVSLIVIIHYLYLYFETTLTTPKVKDLIHCPKQKYHSLFETINRKLNAADAKMDKKSSYSVDSNSSSEQEPEHLGIVPRNSKNNGSDISGLGDSQTSSSSSSSTMKSDLKSFLRTIGLKRQTTQPQRAQYEMN
jgi:hypothetical protein